MAATVLRVKRKRVADPAEALLLACKRSRAEPGGAAEGSGSPRGELDNSVFKLAATVSSQNDPVQKHVREAISREKAARLRRPSSASAQRIQTMLWQAQQASRQENRYRVVASHRANSLLEEENFIHLGDAATGKQAEIEAVGTEGKSIIVAKDNGAVGDVVGQEFQVFDIIQEGETKLSSETSLEDPDAILCNSVAMIREKLSVSDSGRGAAHREKEDDYVYDIYYMETGMSGWIQDILSVVPYREETELVDEDPNPAEVYDDEDDENEENNWRNEYPEEEDSEEEEEENGRRKHNYFEEEAGGDYSDEDGHTYSSGRTWEKYHHDVLREFEYNDGIGDLDSD
ncbi:probable RNA polymerase II nuclear localization protein SLC7A6OS [Latimeria chalumnae]|uniref:Probable RNA polymerase II nuclear localization protein SLC7A6OS n=1 Tax=Latimeria chalumnae TaxID=7897 RepID=H3A345_LATCH|nr:PREDICTED: probable RNA polymerase II nuclear localization protein SLC7A6OS [Latimeria chalumnae]|eukprot:XP_006010763.1 PREDICTED: probable RNA polymerase II nuclear localization protein SLC7A6OS [Latimeria chalumnae]